MPGRFGTEGTGGYREGELKGRGCKLQCEGTCGEGQPRREERDAEGESGEATGRGGWGKGMPGLSGRRGGAGTSCLLLNDEFIECPRESVRFLDAVDPPF